MLHHTKPYSSLYQEAAVRDSPHCFHSLAQKCFNLLKDGVNMMCTIRSPVNLLADKFPSICSASGSLYDYDASPQVAQDHKLQMLESSCWLQQRTREAGLSLISLESLS